MSLFVTGTDTGVGKTYITSRLVRTARRAGLDCVGFKPICCGDRDDAIALHAETPHLPLNDLNPLWFRTPAAPYTAALIENRPIDFALIHETAARLRQSHPHLIIEGAGGWLVPITSTYTFADLATEFALPILLVAANRLGALNHTLLTVQTIEAKGLTIAGIILNSPTPTEPDIAITTNRGILETLLHRPVWELPHGADLEAHVPWQELLTA